MSTGAGAVINANGHRGSVVDAILLVVGIMTGGIFARTLMLSGYGFVSRPEVKAAIIGLLMSLLSEVKKAALDPDNWEAVGLDTALKKWLFDNTGLEIETFDKKGLEDALIKMLNQKYDFPLEELNKEGVKKAAGKYVAQQANAQFGTSFGTLYPVENIKSEIRNQVMAEITNGTRNLLSEADVQAFIVQIRQISDNQLVQQFGVTQAIATGLGLPIPSEIQEPDVKRARRRAQNREAQRKWRQTHGRDSTWYPAGSISSPHPVT